ICSANMTVKATSQARRRRGHMMSLVRAQQGEPRFRIKSGPFSFFEARHCDIGLTFIICSANMTVKATSQARRRRGHMMSLVRAQQGEPNKIRFRKKADFCLYYSLFIIHHSIFINLFHATFLMNNEE
ncbi:MAG: hypothetical protein IKA74_04490, partial [Clostridia bacterium]|nr:hypothetical protein [Clostridia bacterium]